MVVTLDLSASAIEWFGAADVPLAFDQWLERQDHEVKAGFAALGAFAMTPEERANSAERVWAHRERIRSSLDRGTWRSQLDLGLRRTFIALNQTGPGVRLYALVGLGNSDASAVAWRGAGAGFVWLENWLGPGATAGELQDRPVELLAPSVAHELAHAIRYSQPGSASLLAGSAAPEPADVWHERLALPLREVMYDEGLATAFALDAFPELTVEDALGLSAEAVEWLGRQWRRLLRDRSARWDLDRRDPPTEWTRDALWLDRRRASPPWSLESPPTKFGYYIGLQWAKESAGRWPERLSSAPPRVQQAG